MGSALIDGVFHPNENKPEMYRAGENKLIVEMLDMGAGGPIVVPNQEQRKAPIGVVIHVGPGVVKDGGAKVAPFQAGDYVVLAQQFVVGSMPDQFKRGRVLAYWEAVLAIIPEAMRTHLRAEMFTHMAIELPSGMNGRG